MSRKPPPAEGALYVRLPAAAVGKLDRAADALGIAKKELVANLVTRYVDPDSQKGLSALGALTQPRRITVDLPEPSPTVGSYSFQPYDLPEIMNAEQAGLFLQLDEATVLELAESGELPGRKLGSAWRFSRAALVAWLAAPENR